MSAQKPAIGYCRVSTDKQATEGVSLEAQRAKIEGYCALHDLALTETLSDDGISGKRADNRPALQKALAAVCKCKGVLIVYQLTRLGRSTRDCIDIVARIEKCGADIASISEKIDTTSAMGRFFFRLMASLGELEREQIAERTRFALAHKRRKGERTGMVPYGYCLEPDGTTLTPLPDQQASLSRIVQLRAAGHGYRRIANALNADGILAKHGGRWVHTSVVSALHRHSLIGAKS